MMGVTSFQKSAPDITVAILMVFEMLLDQQSFSWPQYAPS